MSTNQNADGGIDHIEATDDVEGHAVSAGRGGRYPATPETTDDVEGHGGKFPAETETTDDVEGHGGKWPAASETTDDVEGDVEGHGVRTGH